MAKVNDEDIKLGIYCRLSVDDGFASNDSISITNQKQMLTDYAKERGWHIENYYIDDGYSGTNFERPGFKEMIYDIECGRINAVITKDLSRLGRDYLKTGYYIDTYFPDRNVRYIAVSDNIDTYVNEDEFLPFKNIINEMYAKDVSKKIRFTIDNQIKTGKDTRPGVPLYGYMYDDDGNRIPNPETAPVVKLIYELFLEGYTYSAIAAELKKKEILCPLYYNYQKYGYGTKGKGEVFKFDFYAWTAKTVSTILTNDAYIGVLRRGKTISKFKSKKLTVVKPEEQHIFVDKFEPIIDKDVFYTAKEQAGIVKVKYKNPQVNRYSGIVYCGKCGRPLRHKFDTRVNRKDFVRLTCRSGKEICGEERGTILYEDLDKVIKKEVADLKKLVLSKKEEFIEFVKAKSNKTIVTDEYSLLLNEKKMTEDSISKIDRYVRKAYEQHVDGVLPESSYLSMVNEYKEERNDLENRLNSLVIKIADEEKVSPNYLNDAINFISALEKINPINCIQTVNLNLLISKIYITTDGKRKRREKMNKTIVIVYKRIDNLIKEFINAN